MAIQLTFVSMSDTEPSSDTRQTCNEVALEFVEAVKEKEFDQAVTLFDDEAANEFLAMFDEYGEIINELEYALRHCRRATEALFGPIESVTVTETTQAEGLVTVALDCETATKQLQVAVDDEGAVTDIEFLDTYSLPEYVDQNTFEERDVTITSGDVELEATVTLPTERDEPPIAVLIPGAGEIDRNYDFGPNQFLKDLAWGLATDGIATLRYDKRETVTDIPAAERTLETEYFTDALEALDMAASVEAVDSDSVFIVGHSRGGMCSFEIARRYGAVAGIVALDPQTFKPLEPDVEWWEERLEIDGYLPSFAEAAKGQYTEAQQRFHAGEYEPEEQLMREPAGYVESAWDYDQFETAESLSCPILLYQLEGAERAPDIIDTEYEDVLDDEDTLIQRPDVNHNFQRGQLPRSMLEPYLFHKNVDERIIQDLAEWINETK